MNAPPAITKIESERSHPIHVSVATIGAAPEWEALFR